MHDPIYTNVRVLCQALKIVVEYSRSLCDASSVKQTLTKKQQQVLQIIRKYRRVEIPSVREIARHLGVKSPATVQQHLNQLRAKGWLE